MSVNATIYTRHTYPVEDPRFHRRLELARRTSIPSVNQALKFTPSGQSWRWVWWCRWEGHNEVMAALHGALCRIVSLPGDDHLEDDDVQLALDSDDMISHHFLDRVTRLWEKGEPYIRTWQPTKLDLRTGKRYRMSMRYSADTPSMFYAVYNPTDRVRIYARTHTRMGELAPTELVTDGPGVTACIHDDNHLMTIVSGDKEIR